MNNNNQHWSCILDPALALSHFGVLLAENLGKELEIWLGRELWNILNNIDFYIQQPELIIPKRIASDKKFDEGRPVLEETLLTLKAWERLRRKTDLAGLNLFWLGDSLKESFLPKSRTLELFGRWEFIARLLESHSMHQSTDTLLSLAFRDTVALAASLGSTFILTYQSSEDLDNNVPPDICQALEHWGIFCQALTPDDPIVIRERNYLRQLLIRAGLAKLLWADLHLAVLHLVVPNASTLYNIAEENSSFKGLEIKSFLRTKSQGFWYQI